MRVCWGRGERKKHGGKFLKDPDEGNRLKILALPIILGFKDLAL
jgi:hypothetical protein